MDYKRQIACKLQVRLTTVQWAVRHSAAQLSDEAQHRSQYGRTFLEVRHTCRWMASFNVGNDGCLLHYTFDFSNPHNQKSQGVISGDLGGQLCGKDPP
ncbi:hypothetical protein AVEN_193932-1 [Araneus ventricosus]|uniref:Uncharacterized protein n=1 Tax=Araneus ventricosus TaxID=182803 RepID=A0A4Y2JWF7_ARAVE|nr:hypothetical protein AVEN_193932-1 [Araneus ventricosus]